MQEKSENTISIQELNQDPNNARLRTDRSAKLISESLEKFGTGRSIVIDENNTLISTINNSIAKQTVLVSEANDLVSSGSMFNFIYVKGSLKYQINKAKAEQNGFKIDQTLTKLAYNPS